MATRLASLISPFAYSSIVTFRVVGDVVVLQEVVYVNPLSNKILNTLVQVLENSTSRLCYFSGIANGLFSLRDRNHGGEGGQE